MVPNMFNYQLLLNIRLGYFLSAISPERQAAVAQITYFLTFVHFHKLLELRSIFLYLVVSAGVAFALRVPYTNRTVTPAFWDPAISSALTIANSNHTRCSKKLFHPRISTFHKACTPDTSLNYLIDNIHPETK